MNVPASTDTGGIGLAEREFPGTHGAAAAVGLMRADTSTALLRAIAEAATVERERAEGRGRTERLDARLRALADKGVAVAGRKHARRSSD